MPQVTTGSRAARRTLALLGIAAAACATQVGSAHAAAGPQFSADYVSTSLAGGEPFVIYSHGGQDLVYSSHEGTTHLYRGGVTQPDSNCDIHTTPPSGFLCSYDNQVITWYSTDGGQTWTESLANPVATGFSDPSLTEDEGNNIYNTGIDLANDAVFASSDGGRTFVTGTPQCHNGDRPWLAGGKSGEVFMATDTTEGSGNGHQVFQGTISGPTITCGNGISDNGAFTDSLDPNTASYSGFGQIYYNHSDGNLIEPADFFDANGSISGVGISVLQNAHAFSGTFTPSEGAVSPDGELGHWPAIAIDTGNTVYVVWDTNPHTTGTNGCDQSFPATGTNPVSGPKLGGPSVTANKIMMAWTSDEGKTWSQPVTVAAPGTTVLWPWITAGAAGNVSVTWYQGDQVTDPDCDSAALMPGGRATNWTVQVANIYGTQSAAWPATSVNAVPADTLHPGGVIHVGGICLGGTGCVATGEDRRLGDYFTNALDSNGCVMVATGDTQLTDTATGGQLSTSRPLFVHQTTGPSLTTGQDCAGNGVVLAEAPLAPGLGFGGVAAALLAVAVVRRRRGRRGTAVLG